jgi:hypothetical protein
VTTKTVTTTPGDDVTPTAVAQMVHDALASATALTAHSPDTVAKLIAYEPATTTPRSAPCWLRSRLTQICGPHF